jgi:hypothetical protein
MLKISSKYSEIEKINDDNSIDKINTFTIYMERNGEVYHCACDANDLEDDSVAAGHIKTSIECLLRDCFPKLNNYRLKERDYINND